MYEINGIGNNNTQYYGITPSSDSTVAPRNISISNNTNGSHFNTNDGPSSLPNTSDVYHHVIDSAESSAAHGDLIHNLDEQYTEYMNSEGLTPAELRADQDQEEGSD
ncbi:hypothetical protein [Athalassotoga saccharophila]|uniref:Uncharacterized protein n=1 Tax=Athalassotoga saccharophila TaxID=1441386 RepID=A0A6N4TF21_9BACT|nr:hypothetical protein [Athalassotoga saccharophila]BBJ29095.1 hypothetical protein ATHSA_p20005 [Athalassotoga saccharophila]